MPITDPWRTCTPCPQTEVQLQDDMANEGNTVTREMIKALEIAIRNREFKGQWEALKVLQDASEDNEMARFSKYTARARGLAVVDEKRGVVTFTVRKRLNLLKTSTRVIKVDLGNRLLKNETVHGRIRKTFPFLQIAGISLNQDNNKKLAIGFIKKGCTVGALAPNPSTVDWVLTRRAALSRDTDERSIRVLVPCARAEMQACAHVWDQVCARRP